MIDLIKTEFPWILDKFYENTVLDYFLSTAGFLALLLILIRVKPMTISFLDRKMPHGADTHVRYVFSLLDKIKTIVLIFVAFYFSTRRLNLPPFVDLMIARATALVVTLQITSLLSQAADYLIKSFSFGQDQDNLSLASARTNLSAIVRTALWIAGILFLFSNFGVDVTAFVTGLGIGGIAIALAAQAILGDVFSSFTIAIDKPFEVGDFIVFDQFRGNIEQIGLKTTRIRSLDGELLIIANSDLTKSRIQNFKKMMTRRVNFKIGVVYGTDINDLREIPAIIERAVVSTKSARFERANFMEFGDFSLVYDIVYHVLSPDYLVYTNIQEQINLQLCQEFSSRNIQFAFPTQTLQIQTLPKIEVAGAP